MAGHQPQPGEARGRRGEGGLPRPAAALRAASLRQPRLDARHGRPGLPVTILPRLVTGDNLLINFGYRGAATAPGADHEATAHVTLCSDDGTILDATTSVFS